jgi:hypothetical protein
VPSDDWLDVGPEVVVAFACTATRPLATPFVSGQWAPAGHTFIVVGLTTNLSDYAIQGEGDRALATYQVATSRDRTRLGGERPIRVLQEGAQGSINRGFLVFDIDGKIPRQLDYRRTYQVKLTSVRGDIDTKDSIKLDVAGRLPLGL